MTLPRTTLRGLRARLPTTRSATWSAHGATLCLAVQLCAGAARAQPSPSPAPSADLAAAALGPAASMVQAGQPLAALAALDALDASAREDPRALVLRGRLLEALGRHADAAAAFARVPESVPAHVARDVKQRHVAMLARAGRCDDAGQLEGANASAKLLVSECFIDARRWQGAITTLRPLLTASGVDTWRVRALLGEALAATRQRTEAEALLRELLVRRPDHRDGERATRALAALGRPLRLGNADRLVRAERYLDIRRPRSTLDELAHVSPGRDRAVAARVTELRGRALFATRRDYEEAAAVLGAAARAGGPRRVELEFLAARALSRTDRDARAIAAFRRFVRAHPDDERAPEAELLAAWTELRNGRREGTLALERFLRGPRAARAVEHAQEARWHLAFDALSRGEARDSIALFDRYAEGADGSMSRARGAYWSARARQLAGDRDAAIERYRRAITVEPLHWYALLARTRLVELGVAPGGPFGDATPEPFARPDRARGLAALGPAARFFAAIGLVEDAARALEREEEDVKRRVGEEGLALAYAALGEADRPYRLVMRTHAQDLRAPPTARTAWIWNAAYPLAFSEFVARETAARSLPPGYLHAIMRQESSFVVRAVSVADALGLLQLLPSTARGIARREAIAGFERESLFVPAINIRLGASYQQALLREFRAHTPLAIAAYNAGSARVKGWLRRIGAADLDAFVESIPVEQTRNYVRRVTTAWARYRYLAAPEAGWPDLGLPARIDPRLFDEPAFEPRVDEAD